MKTPEEFGEVSEVGDDAGMNTILIVFLFFFIKFFNVKNVKNFMYIISISNIVVKRNLPPTRKRRISKWSV